MHDGFLDRCTVDSDGFMCRSDEHDWRLGVVLFVRHSAGFVAVQKAEAEGRAYEFANLWALPGGMVRAAHAEHPSANATDLLLSSARNRFAAETGIGHGQLSAIEPARKLGPIVTSYTAKGSRRHTLVTACAAQLTKSGKPSSEDYSIAKAGWIDIPPDFAQFAPANRLILAHLLWDDLDKKQRSRARSHIDSAFEVCRNWAAEVEITSPALPWSSSENLAQWRRSWASI